MATSNNNEKDLFKELRRLCPVDKDGNRMQNEDKDNFECKPFEEEITKGWHRARKYVLDKVATNKNWGAEGIMFSSNNRVHVVIHYNGNPMSLYIARQVALVMHFLNFTEGDGRATPPGNTTVITILYTKEEACDNRGIIDLLRREEYLCNLPDECKCTFVDWNSKERNVTNEYSYIDIELELVAFEKAESFGGYKIGGYGNLQPVVISQEEVEEACNIEVEKTPVDVTNARRVNMVYNIGADIDNLLPDDPNTAERYSKALLYFCYQQSPEDTLKTWDKFAVYEGNEKEKKKVEWQILLRNKLSNIFCADCLELRILSLFDGKTNKNLVEMVVNHESDTLAKVKSNLQILAKCEHARWNVEKLVVGFSPFTTQEQYEDNRHFGSLRNGYRNKLKNTKAHHIDLCSYKDLRRRNPADMKYDCFLMVAMVRILKENYNQQRTAGNE